MNNLTRFPSKRRITHRDELCDALEIPFSREQLDAITAPLAPGVIIAGAGSGKTTVMAARVVWLVGTGAVAPEEILGLTFTRKAAGELSTRIRKALVKAGVIATEGVDDAGEQVVMTYDAFAGRLVAEHGLRIGVDSEQTMITGALRWQLAARVVANAAGPFEQLSRLKWSGLPERILKLDSDLQAHLVSLDQLDDHAARWRRALESAPLYRGNPYADVRAALAKLDERLEVASLVGDYQELKERLGAVEFADQMAIAARLAHDVADVPRAVREQFKVVLLDEYQDTSSAQAKMLQALFSGGSDAEGRGHAVTAVGDPFQAIYGWRGAAASNILQFATDFPKADGTPAHRFNLTMNRRSGHTILDVANVLAKPLRNDPLLQVDDQEPADTKLRAPENAIAGEVRAATFVTWPEEVTWVADRIVDAHARGEARHWSDIAVLTRRNADVAAIYTELVSRDVPVEIVGLGGLLKLPEIQDITSTLALLNDVTANPELVRLLSGPRWAIGPRDLNLLGQRARELAKGRPSDDVTDDALLTALEQTVSQLDVSEVISLLDAVEEPGDLPYSAEARQRFADFASELAELRSHSDEPLLDLVRRVVHTLGLDVELVATPQFTRTRRRHQLATFLDAVADYVGVDGDASLGGLLAYFRAEIEQGAGLDQAVPSDADSVKLLTVHKAKGLEWDVVFLPALVEKVFPSDRVSDNWIKKAEAIPADLRGDAASIPQIEEATNKGLKAFAEALKTDQRRSEDRLGYVAVTRAKKVVVGSAHYWQPSQIKPRALSDYFRAIAAEARRQERFLVEVPEGEVPKENPTAGNADPKPWPRPLDPDARARRRDAALEVEAARRRFEETGSYEVPDWQPQTLDLAERLAGWDADLDQLLHEAVELRRGRRRVALPSALSATQLLAATRDQQAYAAELIRPMPKKPSRQARFGTRFHLWIERHYAAQGGMLPLVGDDEIEGYADEASESDADLRDLCQAFAAGEFGQRVPQQLETPFTLVLEGQLVRGRIDAVYELDPPVQRPDGGVWRWQVVDWKTSRSPSADAGQLALYRLAWADLLGLPVDEIDAVFYFVRQDRIVRPSELPDRQEIARQLAALTGSGPDAPRPGARGSGTAASASSSPDSSSPDSPGPDSPGPDSPGPDSPGPDSSRPGSGSAPVG